MFQRFLVVGGLGFVVDAGLTMALIHLGQPPAVARLVAIPAAMAFTWLCNRRYTFAVREAASAREGLRYAAVAAAAALLNYLVFAALVAAGMWPLAGVALSTALQAIFSFWAYRRYAFGLGTRAADSTDSALPGR